MTAITVSLTRAHKIAERLKTQATHLLQESLTAGAAAQVNGRTPGQQDRLSARGASAVAQTTEAARYLRAAADVRTVIGRENETRGISAKLAQLDAVNKLVAHTKGLLATAKSGSLELDELAEYKSLGGESAYTVVMVNVVQPHVRENIAGDLDALQREAVKLSDEIAEANAARLTFELEDDLAAHATGAA